MEYTLNLEEARILHFGFKHNRPQVQGHYYCTYILNNESFGNQIADTIF